MGGESRFILSKSKLEAHTNELVADVPVLSGEPYTFVKLRGILIPTNFISYTHGSLLAQHACQYWLPCVLKNVPDALHQMLGDLHSNGGHQSRLVSAHLAILKVARSLGVIESKQLVSYQ